MALTIDLVYSVRFGTKIPLPRIVQDNIAKLRITPVPYKPVRTFVNHGNRRHRNNNNASTSAVSDNWREAALIDIVRRVKEKEDPEYSEVFSIFNKVSPGNVEKLSSDAVPLLQKRDEPFRLRVSTLLFDKAITQPAFSSVMAECARFLNIAIPEIADDLEVQVTMFPKLYNMENTIVFPASDDEHFADKVVEWMSQKEKRRGYAKFMVELYSKELVREQAVRASLEQVVTELKDIATKPKTAQTEENVNQFVVFIFECSTKVKGELKQSLKTAVQEMLAIPKAELPSLNMKSKFKLEDAFKELNKEE